ncbi:malonate decarboxylase holo-[acyl-carrier-protein] synthase [Undibacterium sp. SXout11W]|uniref:malonate decarboxylase holo-[acyl-carrier-protein] synthase n=1 Tax=Undibacterium sp. SXout11W TaxID=3413050 RepID=UPI003BEFC4A8
MDQIEQFQRHDLVWLSHQAWAAVFAQQMQRVPDEMTGFTVQALHRWQQEEWPAVVRRRDVDAADDEVCIGFALVPVNGRKPRIAARVKAQDILEHQPSLALSTVIPFVAPQWQPALKVFNSEGNAVGVRWRVYGSVVFEFLTGQSYVNEQSDIDVLFRPQSQEHLVQGLALLRQFQTQIPLDGEVIFPQSQAVSWKEWLLSDLVLESSQTQRLLVKDNQQVRLVSKLELMQSLSAS